MILIVTVLVILLLIACVGWFRCYRSKQLVVAVSDFYKSAAGDFEYQLHQERLKVSALEQELSERPLPKEDPEQPEEQGRFVRTRRVKRATPETYRIVFDVDVNGQRVLEHLTMVFCKDAFVPDDKGGERQTSYNLGAQGVINFIVNNINQANNPDYKESDE